MVMGSNKTIKERVRKGELCFVCEQKVPDVFVVQVVAWMCSECYENLQFIRRKYALKGGYTLKGDSR